MKYWVEGLNDYQFIGEKDRLVSYAGRRANVITPAKAKIIGASAFKDNKWITSITPSHTVHTIEEDAFAGCENIKHVLLQKALKHIGHGAFSGIRKDAFIIYFGTVKEYAAIEGADELRNVHCDDGIYDGTELWK